MSVDGSIRVKVTIIGAGSAGLSALRQIKSQTDDFVLIDQTPLGTKCARTGCMPSKALLIASMDFHRRSVLEKEGIRGTASLHVELPAVLEYVRQMRNHFTEVLRIALQDAGRQLPGHLQRDKLSLCNSTPETPLR
jgi:dihydrolipoamide dehydrogenase